MERVLPVILFPDFPLRRGEVDPDFADERDAAVRAGFTVGLYGHEAAVAGNVAQVCRGCPPADGVPALLRGWMLREEEYARLYDALHEKGYRLLNGPAAYAEAHYLPRAYRHLEGLTPETVWTDRCDIDAAWRLYQGLRDGDVILKDHVKSAKHRWMEACFIPAGSNRGHFGHVLETFVADRGNLFERGFVLRRYVPLMSRGRDMRGYPVSKETRLFFLDGRELLPAVPEFAPPPEAMVRFVERASRFASRFMTMDLAQTAAGEWIVIEVGDGGVSGLPASLVADDFYEAVARGWGVSRSLGPT
jgi:hypothetical protein